MREFYESQMEEKLQRKQELVNEDIYEKLVLNQRIVNEKNKAQAESL